MLQRFKGLFGGSAVSLTKKEDDSEVQILTKSLVLMSDE